MAEQSGAPAPVPPGPVASGLPKILVVPCLVGCLVALTLGLYGGLHHPTGIAINIAGFSSVGYVKSDPASARRRGVLVGACAAMVAGCSTYNANNGGVNAPAPTSAASTGGPASGGTASGGTGSAGANVLTTTAKVPVGGGQILVPQKIVVT
jgi:hypothetical protein